MHLEFIAKEGKVAKKLRILMKNEVAQEVMGILKSLIE